MYRNKINCKYYKTLARRLALCGWKIIDESHEATLNEWGRIYPHYVHFTNGDLDIEITANSDKDGSPGRITNVYTNFDPRGF